MEMNKNMSLKPLEVPGFLPQARSFSASKKNLLNCVMPEIP